jgi:PmbA protein
MHSYLHGHPALLTAVKHLEHLHPDQFELYFESRTATRIESKDQQVESLTRAEDVGLSVRVIKDNRVGFSFTTSLDKNAIEKAVEASIEVARFMPEDPDLVFHNFGSSVYSNIDILDQKGLSVPMSEKVQIAKNLESICRKADPRIQGIRSAALSENKFAVHMVDSNGEHIKHEGTLYSASISCKAEQDGDSQMGGEFGFSNYLDQIKIQEVGTLAARWATELLGAKEAPTMNCPAIFRNSVVADLLDFISGSFSAEQIAKGRSMLAGKMGERLFSEQVTLVDDGLLPGGYGTSPFDGEGVPCTKTTLVDGGFIQGTLFDNYYAKKAGKESTGNSQRGLKAPPSIGLNNLYMQAGRKSFDQLFDGVSKGILITDLMGIHTANPVTGDFSLGASGILIENGKLTRPVRGFAVAGNVLGLFKRITDVGSDLRFFGSTGAPSVRVSELSVGGA